MPFPHRGRAFLLGWGAPPVVGVALAALLVADLLAAADP